MAMSSDAYTLKGYGQELSLAYRHPFQTRHDNHRCDDYLPAENRAVPANERNMCALSATLRSKPNWWTKCADPEILARWKQEAVGVTPPFGDIPLKEEEVDYVFDELSHFAALRDTNTGIEASIYHRIWQSDSLVPAGLHDQLVTCVSQLENVPDEKKDWHPGSNNQVLDLVHPSMCCIVYGRTLTRERAAKFRHPKQIDYHPYRQTKHYQREAAPQNWERVGWRRRQPHTKTAGLPAPRFESQNFSWLPTDFEISADGKAARALGYINNLHPVTQRPCYRVIEQLVARFLPMWERVLGETAAGYTLPSRTEPEYNTQRHDGALVNPLLLGSFSAPPKFPTVRLNDCSLQIIVKMANIYLMPEKPEYAGGTWHVEGMTNEAIVSTGIYYYDEDNITSSKLAFRAAIDAPPRWTYNQDKEKHTQIVWGIDRQLPLVQYLGAVGTTQGRCIAFPNIYQHQVQPFELADPTKPGHRKIVVLFLVDPHLETPRPSTTRVPPQRQDWMRQTLFDVARAPGERPMKKLPNELIDIILHYVGDGVIDPAQAEKYRDTLMKERSAMIKANTQDMFAIPFNMCEH